MRRLSVVVLVMVAVAVGVQPVSAGELTGPPDRDGYWAHCNMNYFYGGVDSFNSQGAVYASCNTRPVLNRPYGALVQMRYDALDPRGSPSGSLGIQGDSGVDPAWGPGRVQWTQLLGFAGWRIASPPRLGICSMRFFAEDHHWTLLPPGGSLRCTVDRVNVISGGPTATPFPAYPLNWYPGGTPVVLGTIDPPSLYCTRRFREAGGRQYVKVTAVVLNPMDGARDEVKLYTPWAPLGAVATSREWELPLAGSMPESGWRGMCVVNRRAEDGYVVSNPLANTARDSEFPIEGVLAHVDGATVPELLDHSMGPTTAFVSPLDIRDPVQWITLAGGGGAAAAAEAVAAGLTLTEIGLVTGGTALVAAAAFYAYKRGLLDLNLGGCGLMDRIFGTDDGCARPQQVRPYTRSQTLFTDAEGRVITQTALPDLRWRTATAVAEVVIDPAHPEVGVDTVTALKSPPLSPAERTELQELLNPETEGCRLNLLSVLNPLNMFKTLKCALMWAFVPPDSAWSSVATRVRLTFPLNIVSEVVETGNVVVDWFDRGLRGSGCWHLDLSRAHPRGVDDIAVLDWRLPTPSVSGCPGIASVARTEADDYVGDVYGYRWLFRLVAGLAVWWVVALRLIRGFAPGANDEMANVEPPV